MNVVACFGFYTNMLPHAMDLIHILLSILHYMILGIQNIYNLNIYHVFGIAVCNQFSKRGIESTKKRRSFKDILSRCRFSFQSHILPILICKLFHLFDFAFGASILGIFFNCFSRLLA